MQSLLLIMVRLAWRRTSAVLLVLSSIEPHPATIVATPLTSSPCLGRQIGRMCGFASSGTGFDNLSNTKSLSSKTSLNLGWMWLSLMSILNLFASAALDLSVFFHSPSKICIFLWSSPMVQCLAVRTHWSDMSVQPHQMKFRFFFTRPHCHGNMYFSLSVP